MAVLVLNLFSKSVSLRQFFDGGHGTPSSEEQVSQNRPRHSSISNPHLRCLRRMRFKMQMTHTCLFSRSIQPEAFILNDFPCRWSHKCDHGHISSPDLQNVSLVPAENQPLNHRRAIILLLNKPDLCNIYIFKSGYSSTSKFSILNEYRFCDMKSAI